MQEAALNLCLVQSVPRTEHLRQQNEDSFHHGHRKQSWDILKVEDLVRKHALSTCHVF